MSISRALLFAERPDAERIVFALAAIAGTPTPPWEPFTREDGTEGQSTGIVVGESLIQVAVGDVALPAAINIEVAEAVDAVVERLAAAEFAVTTRPGSRRARVRVGGLRLVVIGAAAQ